MTLRTRPLSKRELEVCAKNVGVSAQIQFRLRLLKELARRGIKPKEQKK